MVPFVGHSTIVIPPFFNNLVPLTKKDKYPMGPPANYPCELQGKTESK